MARQRRPKPVAPPVAPPMVGLEGDEPDPEDRPINDPERGPATADAALPVRVRVDVDTLITRTDLGPGRFTFVAAGQLIPLGLEGYPRSPA